MVKYVGEGEGRGLTEEGRAMWGTEGPVKVCSGTADKAERQTLINTSLWFHFTGVQTCFCLYCISGTKTVGGFLLLQYYGWNLDKSRDLWQHFPPYCSASDITTFIATSSHLISKEIMASVQKCFSSLSHERFLPFQQQLNNLDTKQGEETGVKLSVSNWRQPPIIC